jgi:microcystin-dependent protein
MAVDSYLSEIQIFAFPYAPKNWLQCNGQTLAISTNQALFALLGTSFGGNGTTTFNLPDLRSKTSISQGNGPGGNVSMGQVGGEENHTLILGEMPAHNHQMVASSATVALPNPDGNLLGSGASAGLYISTQNNAAAANNFVAQTGGGQGHPNIQPYLALNHCICIAGIFPSRN